MNQVLALEQVLGLEEGRRVWVDANPASGDGVHLVLQGETKTYGAEYAVELVEEGTDSPVRFWPVDEDDPDYGVQFRVWSLPQPPTPEELAANPWPEVEHG